MTEYLNFICRVKSGTERTALSEAAKRVTRAWLPFSFESTRPRRKRRATVTVRPIMPYLFCRATGAERDHLLELRDVFGPVWYIPPQQVGAVDQYRRDVERAFSENRAAWQRNARLFHCQFRRGQIVRLKRDGLDLFMGKFRAVSDDGRYEVDAEMFGRTVLVRAEPHAVMG